MSNAISANQSHNKADFGWDAPELCVKLRSKIGAH